MIATMSPIVHGVKTSGVDRAYSRTLPPLPVHSAAFAASVQPWPLQAFWPWPEDEADLQALGLCTH
jgi:hypothetical protein